MSGTYVMVVFQKEPCLRHKTSYSEAFSRKFRTQTKIAHVLSGFHELAREWRARTHDHGRVTNRIAQLPVSEEQSETVRAIYKSAG